jgi:hypothetical protein
VEQHLEQLREPLQALGFGTTSDTTPAPRAGHNEHRHQVSDSDVSDSDDTIEVSVRGQSKAVEQKYPGTRYTIAQMRFFCSRKTMTVGPVVLYRADGQVVTTTRNDWSEEQLPPPESPAEVELNFFCSRRRGGA